MLKSDIKNAVHKLEPDRGMEYRLAESLTRKPKKRFHSKYAAAFAAVGLSAVLCVGVFTGGLDSLLRGTGSQAQGVTIPKVELPANGAITAKMMPLIVYGGRVYLLSPAQIDAQSGRALLGGKLGTTTGGLTEWSTKGDYVDFSSTIGATDVYAVKGYDTRFRLMTIESLDGIDYPQVFECLNGMNVQSGKDVFGLFEVRGNVASAKYELFESWNNGVGDVRTLGDLDSVNAFVNALYKATPVEMDPSVWDDQSPNGQKFLTLTLKDSTQVQLRLFKNGIAYYNGLEMLFEIDKEAFDSLWAQMS